MRLKNLHLNELSISGNGQILKKNIKPGTLYENDKPTDKTDGTLRIECLLPGADMDTQVVKVPEEGVPQAVLDAKPLTPLKFEGFEGRIWFPKGKSPAVTVKASSVEISDDEIDFG